tara:strand:+ start:508 stop:711 length:204 start_codon:yes stop_codon:yes gene_type:complete
MEKVTLPMISMIFKETKQCIVSLDVAKSNCFDEPMIDKKYNIEKAEQELIRTTILFFSYLEESKIKF